MYARDVPAGQIFYHGTKADLNVGDLIGPGFGSNFVERALNHIYFSATLEAATWGAELARAALGVVGHPHFNIHVFAESESYEENEGVCGLR